MIDPLVFEKSLRYEFDMRLEATPCFPLKKGRAHEVCGPGAYFFALALAARIGGQVLWIREAWQQDQLNPTGFLEFLNPHNLLVARAKNQSEVLAAAEEALRSGANRIVVMELSKPLSLTEGRRLQLSARDGKAMALAIIPEGMGSNAAETRWSCAPVFDPSDSTRQCWKLIKNKSGTLGVWHVRWDAKARCVIMVPPAGE